MTTVSGLDVLALLDIIKNEDLYTKKLNELRNAEKDLADAKFIAATVGQANKFRDEATAIKRDAAELKIRVEAEMQAKKDLHDKELANERAELEKEKQKVVEANRKLQELFKVHKESEKQLEFDKEQLRKKYAEVTAKETEVIVKYRDLSNRIAQAKEILGKENG